MSYIKAPIGVAPFWYVYPKRMQELSEAIKRYVDDTMKNHAILSVEEIASRLELIRKWSNELILITKCYEKVEKINIPKIGEVEE